MTTILAQNAGFCFGVRRAVNLVYEQIALQSQNPDPLPIYTYGRIIHNMEVVRDFEQKGVRVLEGEEDLCALENGVVVIRAHGVARRIHDIIRERGLVLVDATCPDVRRIHKIVEAESSAGKTIIIVGNNGHPEVEGIMGWAGGAVYVVESVGDAHAFSQNSPINTGENICIVSQTTMHHKKFQDIVDILAKTYYNGNTVNTVCNATEERQLEAARIAAQVDAMIVIGDMSSSNTAKLHEICQKECPNTYFVQTVSDLPHILPKHTSLTGITAGASTPNNIIEEVQNYVRTNF